LFVTGRPNASLINSLAPPRERLAHVEDLPQRTVAAQPEPTCQGLPRQDFQDVGIGQEDVRLEAIELRDDVLERLDVGEPQALHEDLGGGRRIGHGRRARVEPATDRHHRQPRPTDNPLKDGERRRGEDDAACHLQREEQFHHPPILHDEGRLALGPRGAARGIPAEIPLAEPVRIAEELLQVGTAQSAVGQEAIEVRHHLRLGQRGELA
jgi:hypothetical protein